MQANYQITGDALQNMQQDTFSRYLLDSASVLESIKHYLRGEEFIEEEKVIDGKTVIIGSWKNDKEMPPPINEKGYRYTMQILTAMLDKVVSTSNLDEEKAGEMVNEIGFIITTTYYQNYFPENLFGFKNLAELDTIIVTILCLLIAQFRRGVHMETLKQLFSQHQIVEQRMIDRRKVQEPQPTVAF